MGCSTAKAHRQQSRATDKKKWRYKLHDKNQAMTVQRKLTGDVVRQAKFVSDTAHDWREERLRHLAETHEQEDELDDLTYKEANNSADL